jgi:DNA anti-recombination protein RmuC
MLGGMSLPAEFENELLRWLDAHLDARFARQERAILEGVVKMVGAMLTEQIRIDGEAQKRELGEEFAKFEEGFAKLQSFIEQMQNLTEKLARIDHALAHGEPLGSNRMN